MDLTNTFGLTTDCLGGPSIGRQFKRRRFLEADVTHLRQLRQPLPDHRTGRWSELGILEAEVEDADRHECGETEPARARECLCGGAVDWVLAAPFRAHVRRLITTTGVPWRTIAVLAAVPSPVLRRLLHGRGGRPLTRLHPHIAGRLFLLTPEAIVDARSRSRTCRQAQSALHLLLARGWQTAELSARSGVPAPELQGISDGVLPGCSQLTEATIRAMAQALWDVPVQRVSVGCRAALAAA